MFGPFCQTAKYNRSIVRIKELQFERKKDISREVMKEMKLMRDLRHDNVNSFIGACVEMSADLHSITLITEYCAKGALNDILENMDIKLDPMFISSLIHDLIKVINRLSDVSAPDSPTKFIAGYDLPSQLRPWSSRQPEELQLCCNLKVDIAGG